MMHIKSIRCYGKQPYKVALIHGGPGAPGTMASLAHLLAPHMGVLEPLQGADSIASQIEELRDSLFSRINEPITLVGHSWGAWLSMLFTAQHPHMVSNLILVGSGPFESHYASSIMPTRMARLTPDEKSRCDRLIQLLTSGKGDPSVLSKFGALMSKADTYAPLNDLQNDNEPLSFQSDVYERVWSEASKLRSDNTLLEVAKTITCPVIAIHGDHDPHPYLGVKEPLGATVSNFEFILLKKCGHTPWMEAYARDLFINILLSNVNI